MARPVKILFEKVESTQGNVHVLHCYRALVDGKSIGLIYQKEWRKTRYSRYCELKRETLIKWVPIAPEMNEAAMKVADKHYYTRASAAEALLALSL